MGSVVEFRQPATTGMAPPTSRPPQQRRIARALPARSPGAVVFRALRDAMSAEWSPLEAAHSLIVGADGGALVLRAARRRLRLVTEDRITPCQARALAAINIAIADLELSAGG